MRWMLALLLLSSVASADDDIPTTHKGEFGISARFGLGVRGIATYNSDYCGVLDASAKNGNAPVCSARSPLFLDLEPSFGVAKNVELTLGFHLGIEGDFGPTPTSTGPHAFRIEPGARFFLSESGHSKLFVQPSLLLDFTNYEKPAGGTYGHDFGVRVNEGYWIDLHRAVGLYFFVSESVELARWISADLDAGIGIQGRYP
ncbi:MAG: hypothetical protein ABI591_15500 [Kofleriaceae bacterium]